MAKEWIEQLAREVKEKNRGAAGKYGRDQHYAGIIATLGKKFFVALILGLQENVEGFRRQLQGDLTSAETAVETVKPEEIKIMRARFPWVDARVVHNGERIALDYAKGRGVEGDLALDRMTRTFAFEVATDDSLFVQDAFGDPPRQYRQPEELARHITELLLSPWNSWHCLKFILAVAHRGRVRLTFRIGVPLPDRLFFAMEEDEHARYYAGKET